MEKPIIFAKTRWQYDSYTDFWRLVELAGFPIVYVDEIDMQADAVYIVCPMNGEMYQRFGENGRAEGTSKLLLWNLERPSGSGGLETYARDNYALNRYFYKVLVSDRMLAKHANSMLQADYFKYVTVGAHDGLGSPGKYAEKQYDIIHLACYSNNRSILFENPSTPKKVFYHCTVAPNGWGDARALNLRRTKFMLNIHQDTSPYIEPLRFVLASMYALPIISEYSLDFYPYEDSVEQYMSFRLANRVSAYNMGTYLQAVKFRDHMLRYFQFRDCVEKFIRGLE